MNNQTKRSQRTEWTLHPNSVPPSPLHKPLHKYTRILSGKLVQRCFGKVPRCSLLVASKTLPFPILWLGCVFWLNTHQKANPVPGNRMGCWITLLLQFRFFIYPVLLNTRMHLVNCFIQSWLAVEPQELGGRQRNMASEYDVGPRVTVHGPGCGPSLPAPSAIPGPAAGLAWVLVRHRECQPPPGTYRVRICFFKRSTELGDTN